MRKRNFKHNFPLEIGTDVIFSKVMEDAWKYDFRNEELNAVHINGNMYRIVCVPLITYNLNRHDVVEVSENGFIVDKAQASKHRSIRVLLYDHDYYISLIESLRNADIAIEFNSHTFFGIDIQNRKQQKIVQKILKPLTEQEVLAYEFS